MSLEIEVFAYENPDGTWKVWGTDSHGTVCFGKLRPTGLVTSRSQTTKEAKILKGYRQIAEVKATYGRYTILSIVGGVSNAFSKYPSTLSGPRNEVEEACLVQGASFGLLSKIRLWGAPPIYVGLPFNRVISQPFAAVTRPDARWDF